MLWKLKQRQQQRLAAEQGTVFKDWGGKIAVALAFPNSYAVGMSNLGFQTVYGILNQQEDIVCERVFYPDSDELNLVREHPGNLLSIESQRPIQEFDLLAFSIPFENDYGNVLEMLLLANLPLHAERRTWKQPLVTGGGIAVMLNPEPLAAFLDFMLIGEAEVIVPDLVKFWRHLPNRQAGHGARRELLRELAVNVSGTYVPALYAVDYHADGTLASVAPAEGVAGLPEKVTYRRAELAETAPCKTIIRTPDTEFSNVTLLEIGRGCGRGCRFCAAGYVYRPLRYHAADNLLQAVEPLLASSPRIGLVSAAVSDHPEISRLCRSLLERSASLSFSSLRADSITPEIASALQASRHQAVAIAPEAGSNRLRQVINKNLSAEQVYAAAEQLTVMGILHLKLYFMIGLPTETQEDLEAIVDLTKGVKHHVLKQSRGQRRLGTITLSMHSFIPKSFTPFQWVGFAGTRELKDRARWIQKALRKVPNVRVHFDLPKWAYIQALLARGDRRTGLFLEKVAAERRTWSEALRSVAHNPDFWVMRERPEKELFPWEIIDLGLQRSYLWEEYQRGLRGLSSPKCEVAANCRRCGVCAP